MFWIYQIVVAVFIFTDMNDDFVKSFNNALDTDISGWGVYWLLTLIVLFVQIMSDIDTKLSTIIKNLEKINHKIY